ncbi:MULTISPECIES: phospholipase D-like domain-containing protein [unclassified Sphingomonas]|uniref:phospholipase D-like domain-containing protein n=1 Tax=unclassified Sphingomonas TaxID=196159 RepID=UPI002151D523|nr:MULTISPECIES: phospholipase D-like domain-containing protein [unclassified Sphingomonas]MCR5872158.1 phospholipase D-like domain-containing protein [Sphingomonas sp. J344]UUX99529.1 phospholipase D-like domain-containing protein [Sphingomonas sp. J315]
MSAGPDDSLLLEPGRNCWRAAQATRLSVIVDAEDYFRVARTAMLQAKKQLLLIGWDFDARILLTHDDPPEHPEAPREVGAFISWITRRNPDLEVHILRWDVGALTSLFRGKTLQTLVAWKLAKRIHLKLDSTHPPGASHHQKIVVIDDCLAFCGGIDMTLGRWDTRGHADGDPGRTDPGGDRYMPWHDATTAIQGPAATMLGDLCRERWHRAGGHRLKRPDVEQECWPDRLTPDFTDIRAAIARTQPELNGEAPVQEIEKLYLDLIGSARRFVYAESQYFASRAIAEAIAKRLAEPDGPEFVIVNPRRADGWLEQTAMDTARARLFQALKQRDPHDRLRLYHPYTRAGDPIYVHAKVLVVDDRFLRVGSSNFNNRSLGLDTECDVALASRTPEEAGRIAAIRDGLLAEHLGTDSLSVAKAIEDGGSLIAAVEALRGTGRSMRPYQVPDLATVEEWLAENQILDSGDESPFEAMTKGGLLRRLGRRR